MSSLATRVNRPVWAILAVGLIAGGLRLWHLGTPPDRVFDEVYYPKAGCILVGGTNEQCDVTSSDERFWRKDKWDVGSWVHPPLGKWMIGLGEKAFGFDPFGWRISSALVGTLTVMLVALLAYLLFGSTLWAFVAGLLMAAEGLSFVMSRTGLLDSFLAFWVALGAVALILDRRWIGRRTPEETSEVDVAPELPPVRVPSPIWRPWRFAAGIALGAGFATKWSALLAIGAAGLLSIAWETTRRRRGSTSLIGALGRAVTREGFGIVLAFVLVPAGVYLLAYLPWFHHFGWSLSDWGSNQMAMWRYHRDLTWFTADPGSGALTSTPTHPWLSHAWTWITMQRPVLFFARYPDDAVRWVTTIGNPAIFWGALWTVPATAYVWWRRRDWRAGFILVAILAQWIPWFAVSRPQFFFYMTPVAPFLVLAATLAIRDLSDAAIVQRAAGGEVVRSNHHPYRPFVWGYVIGEVVLFAWFYPVLTANQISRAAWRLRIWLPGWT